MGSGKESDKGREVGGEFVKSSIFTTVKKSKPYISPTPTQKHTLQRALLPKLLTLHYTAVAVPLKKNEVFQKGNPRIPR